MMKNILTTMVKMNGNKLCVKVIVSDKMDDDINNKETTIEKMEQR